MSARRLPWWLFPAVPTALRVALLVVLLEAALMIGLGVAELAALSSLRIVMGITTAAFFIGYGVLLGACARGMGAGETWGRSIVVLAQLIQLGVAWNYRTGDATLAGAIAVISVIVLVGVFLRPSLAFYEDEDQEQLH